MRTLHLIFIILGAICFGHTLAGQIKSDFAFYRVDNEIYYFSDIWKFSYELEAYRCTFNESPFLDLIEASSGDLSFFQNKVKNLNINQNRYSFSNIKSKFSSEKDQEILDKFLFLFKLKVYLKTQKVIVKDDLRKSMENAFLKNNCGKIELIKGFSDISKLIEYEVFFGARFNPASFWASTEEIKEYQKKHPELAESSKVSNLLKQMKMKKSFLLFKETLDKQVEHEAF